MIPSSDCQPWSSDQPGQCRKIDDARPPLHHALGHDPTGTRAGALQNGFRSVPAVTRQPMKLGLLGRFGAPQPRPSEAGGVLRVRRLAPRRRPGREAKLLSLSPRSDAQSRPSSIPSLGDGVMLGTAWIDGQSTRRAALPASTSSQRSMEARPCQANDGHSSRVLRRHPEALRGRPETTDTVAAA